jgi:hypothetical protein
MNKHNVIRQNYVPKTHLTWVLVFPFTIQCITVDNRSALTEIRQSLETPPCVLLHFASHNHCHTNNDIRNQQC